MAGYKRPPLLLVFSNPEFEGLEVRAKRPSVGDIFDLARLRTVPAGLTEEQIKQRVAEFGEKVVSFIKSWNLEEEEVDDEGKPTGRDVPVLITPEGVMRQDWALITAILAAIGAGGAGVSPPLPRPSDDGVPSPAASIPMETLSPSPPN